MVLSRRASRSTRDATVVQLYLNIFDRLLPSFAPSSQQQPHCTKHSSQLHLILDKDHLYQGQTYGDETHFVCPWHGYEYDLKTGECIGDRKLKLRKYDIVKRGEDIYVVA